MKKFLTAILALALSCCALFSVGCDKDGDEKPAGGGTENSQGSGEGNGNGGSQNGGSQNGGVIGGENELPPVPIS